jgi:hypothetical protein
LKTVAKFKITGSFKLTGRGIVAMGDVVEGTIKVGNFATFNTGLKDVTLKIRGVDIGDGPSKENYFVGLTFVYKNQDELLEYESIKLKEQVIEISAE